MRFLFLMLLMSITMLGACKNKTGSDVNTVDSLNIDKYLGKWYEIARFPHRFEKDLIGVTAHYSRRDDGKITVVNAGYDKSFEGKYKEITGVAKIPDERDPSKLKVSFFLFFYADYYILEVDTEKYQYALVGSSSDNYLWILSRSPFMPDDTYAMLVEKARQRGYEVENLIKVEQKPLPEFDKNKQL